MKAIIFARVSSANDRQNTNRQIDDLTNYASATGITVVRVFDEKISGGTKNTNRPVLNEAIEFCRAEAVDVVLVSELSRLGRNVFEVLDIIKKLADMGVDIYFQKENINLLDENGKSSIFMPILLTSLSMCAELERENIKYRLASGRANYVAHGGKLGRKSGSVKSREDKQRQYKGVIKRLRNAEKIRDIAKLENVGISTVQRIKKEFKL